MAGLILALGFISLAPSARGLPKGAPVLADWSGLAVRRSLAKGRQTGPPALFDRVQVDRSVFHGKLCSQRKTAPMEAIPELLSVGVTDGETIRLR